MGDFLKIELFSVGDISITIGKLILASLLILALFLINRLLVRRLMPLFFKRQEVEKPVNRKICRGINWVFLLVGILGVLSILELGVDLYRVLRDTLGYQVDDLPRSFNLRVSTILQAFLVWQVANLLHLLLGEVILRNFFENRFEQRKITFSTYRSKDKNWETGKRFLRNVLFALAILFISDLFGLDFSFGGIDLGSEGNSFSLTFHRLIIAIIIILSTQLGIWLVVHLFLSDVYRRQSIDVGSQFAINQLFRYAVYFFALLFALSTLGIPIGVLASGAAALLLGVGLGLQQTFNDFFSGILLLFERSVEIGDVVEFDGLSGKVAQIGLRSSIILTRDNLDVIVPNSVLVGSKVTNWSHHDDMARFLVGVGVAYGSDTALVKETLLEVAKANPRVLERPPAFVRFTNFGDSSLDFELHFWSKEFMPIEDVKSDLRFAIDQAFRNKAITIPFPQRDLWVKQVPEPNGFSGREQDGNPSTE